MAALGGRLSVLHRQREDHIELDGLLRLLEQSSAEERRTVLRRVNRLVFPHAFAEEAVLWPVLRKLPDGELLTLRVEREHQEVNQLVSRLEIDELEETERADCIRRLIAVLREDIRDEEDVLLPRLQQVLTPRRLRILGVAAPTRPHPVVSRRPPGNVLSALPLSALDRTRDGLDASAGRVPARAGAGCRSVSHRLGLVAAALEQLGPLRRGEHASTRVAHRA